MTPTEQATEIGVLAALLTDESGTLKDKKLRIVNSAIGVLKMQGMVRLRKDMEAAKVIIQAD